MDLLELRILAAGGILLVGIVVSTLAVSGVAVAGWIGRRLHPRATGAAWPPAVRQGASLDAGRARC